jgi:hypothetical protein
MCSLDLTVKVGHIYFAVMNYTCFSCHNHYCSWPQIFHSDRFEEILGLCTSKYEGETQLPFDGVVRNVLLVLDILNDFCCETKAHQQLETGYL